MKKFKKIFIIVPIILGVLLILASLYNSYTENVSLKIVVGTLLIIVPYIYTVLPIVKERYKFNNISRNRLSDNTFTDREKDLQKLLDLLNNNKRIQLTGNDSKCGKSWLALKVVDYANHINDKEFKKYSPLKKKFKNAYYIDMNKTTVNSLFEDNIVTSRTLIVADHIQSIDCIFTKQENYKFSLIFVTATSVETLGKTYYISEFERDNIPTLQENIKKNYNNIEALNKKEIDVLYDVTFGNIGKIHFLLERQEYVLWIKQISQNLPTMYDTKLNAIQCDLFCGKYSLAQAELNKFEFQYSKEIPNNNDLYFKFYVMKSDCEHLLNNYQNALDILNTLKRKEFVNHNVNNKINILEAHYYKHLWQCDKALIILQRIQSFNICGLTDALGILVAKYFVDDLSVPNSNLDSLTFFIKTFEMCAKSSLKKNHSDCLKILRNKSIYLYYKKCKKKEKLFKPINDAIEEYRNENNRLLANAYFIRAELNRLLCKYKAALYDYNRCLTQTEDNNIKIQVNIMKYYLATIKNVTRFKEDPHLSKEQIFELCKNKNCYGELLIRRINSIELEDPDKKQIIDCFEHRIMTIL